MSFSCFSRLKNFSTFSKYISREYFLNINGHRHSYISLKRNQQVNFNKFFGYRTSHSGCAELGNDNISTDCDADLLEFNSAYELVRKAIIHTNDKAVIDAVNWSAKVLDYNVQGGKKNRGVTVLKAFKIMSEEKTSPEGILEACILGWCVELLQGFFLVCDDIMDHSTMRRGKPCWYKMPDVGLIAINDGLLLECGIYKILEMYLKNSDAYNNVLHEFLQVTRKTVYGQTLDMLNVPPNSRPRFENFNLEKYEAVVEYKTSHYTFCLPVHLAMHLIGGFSEEDFESTRNICLKLGLLFQIQDDHIDTFGNPNVTGKVGNDIIEGKCSWFAASLCELASESKKKIMIDNYGMKNEDSVSKVMQLYKEFHLEEKFFECEKSLITEITLMIDNLSTNSLQKLFQSLLQKLYKRKK